jgi:hypothetical protein
MGESEYVACYNSIGVDDPQSALSRITVPRIDPVTRQYPEAYASLTLKLTSGDRIARDRFVMFGDSYVWDLGHGLEPFEPGSRGKDVLG